MNLNKFLGIFILLNSFAFIALAQNDTFKTIAEEEEVENLCVFEKTNQTRQNTFPFNQADLIIITSFPKDYVLKDVPLKDFQRETDSLKAIGYSVNTHINSRKISKKKSLRRIPIWVENRTSLRMGASRIPYDIIYEAIILNQSQIDNLFSILYYQKNNNNNRLTSTCYNPHHAIIFYRNSRIIASIEICFSCSNLIKVPYNHPEFELEEFCNQKWCMLQKLFYSIGIRRELELDECK